MIERGHHPARVAGGSIEDYTGRPDAPLYPIELAAERIRAAVESCSRLALDNRDRARWP